MSAVQRPTANRPSKDFERYLERKHELRSLTELRPFVYEIQVANSGTHIATLVNYYLLSESDLLEIRAEDPDADAIVNVGQWNNYKPEVRALANDDGVGLFDFKEFMRAVHYTGDRFFAAGTQASAG